MKKGELEADKDRMMREYRAQLDAERAVKLAHGRNHSSSKSSRRKGKHFISNKKRKSLLYFLHTLYLSLFLSDKKEKDSKKRSSKKRKVHTKCFPFLNFHSIHGNLMKNKACTL